MAGTNSAALLSGDEQLQRHTKATGPPNAQYMPAASWCVQVSSTHPPGARERRRPRLQPARQIHAAVSSTAPPSAWVRLGLKKTLFAVPPFVIMQLQVVME